LRINRFGLFVAVAAALAGCSADTGQCVVHPVAELRTLDPQGLPLVNVTIGSRPAAFAIDTGASDSMLVGLLADEAGLRDRRSGVQISGANGVASNRTVTVSSLTVGYATAQDVQFFVYGRRLPVTRTDGTPVDGLFGGDFLSNYDLFLDLDGRKVGIYQTEHCNGSTFLPLGRSEFMVPIVRSRTRVVVTASIDGHAMPFLLDSGASGTSITVEYARTLGLTSDALAADPVLDVRGTGSHKVVARVHRFREFALGDDHVQNPAIVIFAGSQNVLGNDFLRRNRVWISYAGHQLHVQPRTIHAPFMTGRSPVTSSLDDVPACRSGAKERPADQL